MKSLLSLFFLAFVSCTASSQTQGVIRISVDVEKLPELGLVISTLDNDMRSVDFDDALHGEFVIEGRNAAYITLHNGFSERMGLYVEDGDHLHLVWDGENMGGTMTIKGGHPAINKYLAQWSYKPHDQDAYSLPLADFETLLKKKTAENLKLMEQREKELATESEMFVKLERARVKYVFALSLLNYPRLHGWRNNAEIEADYYETLRRWIDEDADYLNIAEYRTFVLRACNLLAGIDTKVYELSYDDIVAQLEYIAANIADADTRQGLMSVAGTDYIKANGIRGTEELDGLVRANVTDGKWLGRYAHMYDSWDAIVPGRRAPDFRAVDVAGKEYSLKDFRNANVCIFLWLDVYPCFREFAELKKLESLFAENNVRLVNLYMQDDKGKWEGSIAEPDNQTGTHLYMGHDRGFLHKYHYNSYAISQFILIGPDGTIIETHAPAPSSGGLEKFIREHI